MASELYKRKINNNNRCNNKSNSNSNSNSNSKSKTNNKQSILPLSWIAFLLILLQCGRIGLKQLCFLFTEHTVISDMCVSSVYMVAITVLFLLVMRKRKINLKLFPDRFHSVYVAFSVLLAIFTVITCILHGSSEEAVLSLLYGGIVTVVYEELIFRGYVYTKISDIINEKMAVTISTILFGIWHIGYCDTVLWRTSVFSPDANIPKIFMMKVLTGMILGIFFGLLRYKGRNVYASALLHTFLNVFGS